MSNFLSIKFHRPQPPLKHIPRPALTRSLDEGLALGRPVTLVSAPAGFGKTTCASEWLSALALPVAWLSLDSGDNDPGRFFTYLIEALRRASPGAFPALNEVQSMLLSGLVPPADVIAQALCADALEYPGRFVLVLDDFHLIQERFILTVFEKLIAALFQPNLPQPLHLVLLTREDPALPLARLRASNQLNEIRAADLRLTLDEAGRFLNEVMELALSPSEVATLTGRTEGWMVGLQLVGLSIRGRSDPSRFIAGLSGSQRFILSYLIEEVLDRQPPEIQDFLLSTAFLDRLSGDLCNAVTGRSDCHLLLEQLWRANLFLVPLDDEQGWYRYHHLFANLLRGRQAMLQGERTAGLHQRAARWFARACAESAFSERAPLANEAIRHALAAEDYAYAVELIEAHAMEILNQWYAKTVVGWMQALPPEWSARSPRTNLAFAQMHLMRADFVQAAPYLDRLQGLFSDPLAMEHITPSLRAEWLALQATLLSAQGQPAAALALAQQALGIAPENAADSRIQVYLALASVYQQLDDFPRAVDAYLTLIRLGQVSGNLACELSGLSALSLIYIQRGKLRQGFELALQASEKLERSGVLSPICAGIYGELGSVTFNWFELEQAERYMQRSAQVNALAGFSDAEIYYAVIRSRLAQLRGDLDTAAREIHKAVDQMRVDAPAVVREEVIAQQVNVALAQGDLEAAQSALYQEVYTLQGRYALPDVPADLNIPYQQGILYLSALRILLRRARERGESSGLPYAERLIASLRKHQFVPLLIETLLLRAQLRAALGQTEAAQDDYAEALALAEPEGYISLFVTEGPPVEAALRRLLELCRPDSSRAAFIQKLLDAFSSRSAAARAQPPAQSPGLVEPLTERELEVLGLMAAGSTYEEIAAALVVSINTVRSHVKSVYGKLGANNRTTAVETARSLNLL